MQTYAAESSGKSLDATGLIQNMAEEISIHSLDGKAIANLLDGASATRPISSSKLDFQQRARSQATLHYYREIASSLQAFNINREMRELLLLATSKVSRLG